VVPFVAVFALVAADVFPVPFIELLLDVLVELFVLLLLTQPEINTPPNTRTTTNIDINVVFCFI
jgi:hypothetical protein